MCRTENNVKKQNNNKNTLIWWRLVIVVAGAWTTVLITRVPIQMTQQTAVPLYEQSGGVGTTAYGGTYSAPAACKGHGING